MSGPSCTAFLSFSATRVTHGGPKTSPMRHQISSEVRNYMTLSNLVPLKKIHTHTTPLVSSPTTPSGRISTPEQCVTPAQPPPISSTILDNRRRGKA